MAVSWNKHSGSPGKTWIELLVPRNFKLGQTLWNLVG